MIKAALGCLNTFNLLISTGIVCCFEDKSDPVVLILSGSRMNIWIQFPVTKVMGRQIRNTNGERKPGLFIFLEGDFGGLSHFDYFGITHSLRVFLVAKEGKGNTLTYCPKNVWLDLQR